MNKTKVILITGTSNGIGRFLAKHYASEGFSVVGCSRKPADIEDKNYLHFCLDIANEILDRL